MGYKKKSIQEECKQVEDQGGGWIVVTRRKKRQQNYAKKEARVFRERKRRSKLPKRKGKKITRKPKLIVQENEELSRPRKTVTLAEFLPSNFLKVIQEKTVDVVACHVINTDEDPTSPPNNVTELGGSSSFSIEDLLSLPQVAKGALIEALINSDTSSASTSITRQCTSCCMSIGFSDEDLLLGSKPHNRPLFVSGFLREQRVSRILIDDGSAVNIMPKSTMKQLGISMEELTNSRLVIQGFNQGGQRAIGMVRLELIIGDLKAETLFHVIDSKTTYKLLLGRLWIHGNGVITSTLHQCFKFYQDGVKKVEADTNPFLEAESHFVDAKFYLKGSNIGDTVPTEVPLIKGSDRRRPKPQTEKKKRLGEEAKISNSGKSKVLAGLARDEASK